LYATTIEYLNAVFSLHYKYEGENLLMQIFYKKSYKSVWFPAFLFRLAALARILDNNDECVTLDRANSFANAYSTKGNRS
jgi:hypothetical protein